MDWMLTLMQNAGRIIVCWNAICSWSNCKPFSLIGWALNCLIFSLMSHASYYIIIKFIALAFPIAICYFVSVFKYVPVICSHCTLIVFYL